jgi:hypothetical protein
VHRTETEEPLIFDKRTAWQVAIYKDKANVIVVMKCSQIGLTVFAIICMIDLLRQGIPVIYVLPTKVTMYNFVKNRIDPILADVPFYRDNYATNKEDASGSQLKTLFKRRVKLAGSNVRNAFFEMPAGAVIIDERDLCDSLNLKYLEDRMGRVKVKRKITLGNPSFDKIGIHKDFTSSNQQEWNVTCEHCKLEQTLTLFENCIRQVGPKKFVLRDRRVQAEINKIAKTERLEIAIEIVRDIYEQREQDARVYCREVTCQKPIDRHGPGRWIAKYPERPVSGYHLNKIVGDPYAPAIITLFYKLIESLYDPGMYQHFQNNELGVPYEESGNRITEGMLEKCVRDYERPFSVPCQILQHDIKWTVGGCDVGERLHLHVTALIREKNRTKRVKLFIGTLGGGIDDAAFVELHDMVKRYNIVSGVIDAMPETRLARKFCKEHPGWFMAWYKEQPGKKELNRNDKTRELSLNRTEAMDASLASADCGDMILPPDWRYLDNGEFLEQMKMPIRYIDPKTERPIWTKGKDHHRHTDTYDYWASMMPGAATWGGIKVDIT